MVSNDSFDNRGQNGVAQCKNVLFSTIGEDGNGEVRNRRLADPVSPTTPTYDHVEAGGYLGYGKKAFDPNEVSKSW